MNQSSIPELQFQNRAFLSHLSEMLRKLKKGETEVQGDTIENEILRTETRIEDLKELVKRRIHAAG